jgi:hypothetical protein
MLPASLPEPPATCPDVHVSPAWKLSILRAKRAAIHESGVYKLFSLLEITINGITYKYDRYDGEDSENLGLLRGFQCVLGTC